MTLENKAEAELPRGLGHERIPVPAAEEQLRLLLDVSLVGVCSCDLSGRVLEANDPFMRMLGITREEVRARTIDLIELALPSRRAEALEARRRIVEEGALAAWETELVRPDGKRVPVLLSGARLPWRATAVMFAQDLSEARRKEAALQSAEERLSLLLEAMPAVLFEFDASGATAFQAGAEEGTAQRGAGGLDASWVAEPAVATLVQRALAGEQLRARVERGGRLFDSRCGRGARRRAVR